MDAVRAILQSRTFWMQSVPYLAGALACLLVLGGLAFATLARRSAKPRDLAHDDRGAAEAVDFVLTFPIVLTTLFLFVQFALAANASMIVHYAAYTAARSARVYYFERTPSFIRQWLQGLRGVADFSLSTAMLELDLLAYFNQGAACLHATDAARMVLIAAAPSNITYAFDGPDSSGCQGSQAWSARDDYIKQIAQLVPSANVDALKGKMQYAFSPQNSVVDVSSPNIGALWPLYLSNWNFRMDSVPVAATVSFRFTPVLPLLAVPGFFQQGPDGRLSYWMTARVEVL